MDKSTEAEVRAILTAAVKPVDRLKIGEALWQLGRELQLTDDELVSLESAHDTAPAQPMSFEE